jgi:hypothetical protein
MKVRMGSYLFESKEDLCFVSGMCGNESWVVSEEEKGPTEDIEMLVTEHWSARCINNGIFYVKSSSRTVAWFLHFIGYLANDVFADNQNAFDAFLGHSTVDAFVPEDRPMIRYAVLDVSQQFTCAEGWNGDVDKIVWFHFWASDGSTREYETQTADEKEGRKPIAQKVLKVITSKRELFQLFLPAESDAPGLSPPQRSLLEELKWPRPSWRGMCSVTSVGVEELMEETAVVQKIGAKGGERPKAEKPVATSDATAFDEAWWENRVDELLRQGHMTAEEAAKVRNDPEALIAARALAKEAR